MSLFRPAVRSNVRGAYPQCARFKSTSAAAVATDVQKMHPRLVLENLDVSWDYSARMRIPQRRLARPVVGSFENAASPNDIDPKTISPHRLPVVPVKFTMPKVDGNFEMPPNLYNRDFKKLSDVAPRKMWSANEALENEIRASALNVEAVLKALDKGAGTACWDSDEVCEARDRVALWVEQLHRCGVGMLTNVKPQENAILDVVRTIFKAERGTAYGPSFTIKSVKKPNNLAYNSEALLGHTDQPYMVQPPGIQLFHCIKQAETGGESRFLDGFALAHKIWKKDKDAFDVLTKSKILFHDLTPDWHLEAYHTTFELAANEADTMDGMPALRRVNFNEQCRDSWRQFDGTQSLEELGKFYDALTMLENLVWEEKELSLRMQAGEVIVSDNWRTLHNRSAFVGARHFEGCYIDWDIAEGIWRRSSRANP